MDPNNSDNNNRLFWDLIEEDLMDNTDEGLLMSILERQRQSNSSTRRRRRRTVIDQSREEGHNQLFNDYFSENPVYTDAQFRRRFRMHRHVFLRIVEALGTHDHYFQMRVDSTGKMGLSLLQKCTGAIRILAYRSPANSVDDYVRIGENTAVECLERFVSGVYAVFGAEYLRRPNNDDIERLLRMRETRGFSGSNNDINILNQSNVFNDVLEGQAPTVQYTVNRTQYNMGYYLADVIYPEWAAFVKTIPMPQGEKRKLFAQQQESARKDVEGAFGVFQFRFAIIRGPTHA